MKKYVCVMIEKKEVFQEEKHLLDIIFVCKVTYFIRHYQIF